MRAEFGRRYHQMAIVVPVVMSGLIFLILSYCQAQQDTTEIRLIPNIGEWRLAKGGETFFSFIVTNITQDHTVIGTVRKFTTDSLTPITEVLDTTGATVDTFPKYNSTEEHGYALTQSIDMTPTGEVTLELFFRVRGNETDSVTKTEFKIVYIDTGTETERGFRREKTVRILWGEHSNPSSPATPSSSQKDRTPCVIVINGGSPVRHTWRNILIAVAAALLYAFY